MNNRYSFVSIDRIFSKLIRDSGSSFDEGDVVEWCGEALEFIGANKLYDEAVAFIEVKNHQAEVPKGLHAIIQIARDRSWTRFDQALTPNNLCPKNVIQQCQTQNDFRTGQAPDCQPCIDCGSPNPHPDYIVLDCHGQPIVDYDLAYYRPYFDLKYEHDLWTHSGYYDQRFTPVRLANHTLFNSLVCQEVTGTEANKLPNPIRDTTLLNGGYDEYTVIQNKVLRFSFREGFIALGYLKQVMDTETGYPMIPDNISYTTAITKYIMMMMALRDFNSNREGSKSKLDKFEADWHWYCKQAGNIDMMVYGLDEHQNMLDQRSYLLPRQNNYYSYFGYLARPENRSYNDPDRRNTHYRFFN